MLLRLRKSPAKASKRAHACVCERNDRRAQCWEVASLGDQEWWMKTPHCPLVAKPLCPFNWLPFLRAKHTQMQGGWISCCYRPQGKVTLPSPLSPSLASAQIIARYTILHRSPFSGICLPKTHTHKHAPQTHAYTGAQDSEAYTVSHVNLFYDKQPKIYFLNSVLIHTSLLIRHLSRKPLNCSDSQTRILRVSKLHKNVDLGKWRANKR